METLDFLAEMQEKYSLDSYRQKFALTNGLPLPPPSWDRLCTPPIPSSPPPPIVEISNYEEAKNAIRAWSKGCNVHLQVSQQLSLANAEQISDLAKVAKAEQVILNLSVLEAKVTQAKFIRKMIRHTRVKFSISTRCYPYRGCRLRRCQAAIFFSDNRNLHAVGTSWVLLSRWLQILSTRELSW
ncbi:hypothetical protein ACQ4PT_057610 [Festuca glaucescens]